MKSAGFGKILIVNVKIEILKEIENATDLVSLSCYVYYVMTKPVLQIRISISFNEIGYDFIVSSICSKMNSTESLSILKVDKLLLLILQIILN